MYADGSDNWFGSYSMYVEVATYTCTCTYIVSVSLESDELQELYQMRDATRLQIAKVMNVKPGVKQCRYSNM